MRETVEACRAAGVILRVAFQIRLEEILVRVREIVRSGALASGEDGVRVIRIAGAVLESIESRRSVAI